MGGRTIDYTYDAEDRIISVIDSEEGMTQYTYDVLGQMTSETKIASGGASIKRKFVYDCHGNILQKGICDANGDIIGVSKDTYAYTDNV